MYGVNKSYPSVRTYLYQPVGSIDIPVEYTVTQLPKVKNQGAVNSCCACAAVEILEILNLVDVAVLSSIPVLFRGRNSNLTGFPWIFIVIV